MRTLQHVFYLGIKELSGLLRDPVLLTLVGFGFTFSIYASATAAPETLNKAALAVVDEDQSLLSNRIVGAFYPPYFLPPAKITSSEVERGMDVGRYTFALQIPPEFERDVLAGRTPAILLSVDATRLSQAFTGAGYIQSIVTGQVDEFLEHHRGEPQLPVALSLRVRFNPELNQSWFAALMEVVDQITVLSIVLTGAALLREREHGTVEHLLVMPVTPFEIMASKIWSMELAVLVAAAFSLKFVVQGLLSVPVQGSLALFLAGSTLHLFAATALGIFLGTFARSMPQFGLLFMLVIMPMQMLSGGMTPRESMPEFVQIIMLATPSTHFVILSQAILFRGAGLEVVWPQYLALVLIGGVLFGVSLARFRKTLGGIG